MNFSKIFYKYKPLILAVIFIGNFALFIHFLVQETGWFKENKKTYISHLSKAFEHEKYYKEIYHNKLQVDQLAVFLQKYADTMLSFHIQKDFKPVQKNDGGYFMYKKTEDIFHFYNQKGVYAYLPVYLRDSLKKYFNRFDGLITGFTLESSRLHQSLNNKKCNILFRLKYNNKDFPNNISHSIYVNKKLDIFSKTRMEWGDLWLKDTLYDKNKYYVISAFVAMER
jgi:hypothetical protein